MVLEDLELVLKTLDDVLLAGDLRFVVSLESSHADLKSIFSHSEVLNLGLQTVEISLVELVRLNLSPVSCSYAVSESLRLLLQLVAP